MMLRNEDMCSKCKVIRMKRDKEANPEGRGFAREDRFKSEISVFSRLSLE